MARMHSRKHGRSRSHKPLKKKPVWLMYEKNEIESLIAKFAKEGKANAEIGIILRDQYGVPDVRALGLRIAKVTEKHGTREVPEDMYNLIRQAVNLHKHLQENKKDSKAVHGLELLESKVRRLGKYYVREGRLPQGWKYSIDRAKLIVK
ncbi:MAG: 30S ribosomal protein S15 [Candidatus Aenigmarchaeota archaeon]|nr:30S ribosomal protein S15 [Candidatus Aenigmarchaeota archaeon]